MIEINSIVDGKVTSVMPFGAFVSIDADTSGLVHISEISKEYINDINDFIKKGDKVKVKVIAIDDNGKITLSIKQAAVPKSGKTIKPKQPKTSPRPDSFDWTARSAEELSFEDKLSKFKHESEEKMRDSKRRLENKRSGGYSRKGY